MEQEGYLRDIVDYLEKNLSKGYKVEGLKMMLQNQGYAKSSIEKAMRIVEARKPKQKIEEPKEEPKIEAVESVQKEGMIVSFLKKLGILR